MKALELFESVQGFLGLTCDPADGYTWGLAKDPNDPSQGVDRVIVPEADRRLLAMPTDAWLDDVDHDKYVTFQPLCESSLCAESPVIDFIRQHAQRALHERAMVLAEELLRIGVDTSLQAKFNKEQTKLMAQAVIDPLKATVKDFTSLQGSKQGKPFISMTNTINFYIKRGGTYQGQTCLRLATVRSPILDQMSDTYKTINDSHKLTERSYNNIKQVLTFILGPANREEFNYGSNNGTAPYYDAICHSMVKVQEWLNEIAATMKEFINDYSFIYSPTSWIRGHAHLREMNALMPLMPFNSGVELSKEVSGGFSAVEEVHHVPDVTGRVKAAKEETTHKSNLEKTLEASAPVNPGGMMGRDQWAAQNQPVDAWGNSNNNGWGGRTNSGWGNGNSSGGWGSFNSASQGNPNFGGRY